MKPDILSAPNLLLLSLLALLILPSAGCRKSQPPRVLSIEPGYARTRVNAGVYRHHGILSFNRRQFVSFYDPDSKVTFAWRDLPSEQWTVHHTDWKGATQDAHNSINMGVSTDGVLHVAWDHHANTLRYRRSAKPLDPTTFGPIIAMTGKRENKVTYPAFVTLSDGTLLFFYRDGYSGNGDLCINRYDVKSQTWRALQHPAISGEGRCNPYWCRPAVGNDGSLQLAWCWRRNANAETNKNLCYARSLDGGLTWQDSHGKPYRLPITPDTAEVIDLIPENSNLSNQDSSEVDNHNRFHVVYRKNDETGIPQYYHQWWDGREWRRGQVSQFKGEFRVKGVGTKAIPMSRPNLLFDKDDGIYVLYRDTRQGSRPMVATAAAPDYNDWRHIKLVDADLLLWEPIYDLARWRQEGVLNMLMQSTGQGDHEKATDTPPQMVGVLEWRP